MTTPERGPSFRWTAATRPPVSDPTSTSRASIVTVFPAWSTEPATRKRELWAYVDVRDVAQMVRLCVDTDGLGLQVFNAFAGESAHALPTRELAGKFYPKVPMREEIAEHGSLVSNRKAQRLLGFEQRYRWAEQPQA